MEGFRGQGSSLQLQRATFGLLKKLRRIARVFFLSKITDLRIMLNKEEWATLASASQRWHRAPRSAPLSPHTMALLQSKASGPPLWARLPAHLWEHTASRQSALWLENGHCELHPAAQQSLGGGEHLPRAAQQEGESGGSAG